MRIRYGSTIDSVVKATINKLLRSAEESLPVGSRISLNLVPASKKPFSFRAIIMARRGRETFVGKAEGINLLDAINNAVSKLFGQVKKANSKRMELRRRLKIA